MTAQTDSLRMINLKIDNYLRIDALNVEVGGNHLQILGPNGSGKTSAVKAIWECLAGTSGRDTPEPIRHGTEKASVRLNLDGYTVERHWTEKGTRLIVTAADGSKVTKPQQLLDGLLGRYSLDPVAFLARRPQDQVDDVLHLAGVEPPVQEVQAITGETHPAAAGVSACSYLERLSADDAGLFYVRRREANRVCDQKRAALEEERSAAPPDSEGPAASASEILAAIETLQRQADERRAAQDQLRTVQNEHLDAANLLGSLREELDIETKAIQELEATLQRRHDNAASLVARIEKGRQIVAGLEAERGQAEVAFAKLSDPSPQIAQHRQQLAAIERTQAARIKHELHSQRLQSLAAELEAARSSHLKLDQTLSALRSLRANLLNGLDLGVPGLTVGEGELRLNDVPFRQASQAEQIRVACAVAMHQKPKLKLLRIDDGEHLDRNSRELLLRLADASGFQVVMTSVADCDGLRVEIIDAQEAT